MPAGSLTDAGASAAILARAHHAMLRDQARVAAAIEDYFLADEDRLDDRTRARMAATIAATIERIALDLAGHVSRRIARPVEPGVTDRLLASGLLRHRGLIGEVLATVREQALAAALAERIAADERSDLLSRLASCPDWVVASAARALAAALNAARDGGVSLSGEVQSRLVWWVAAALREEQPADAAFDQALAEAAERSLAAHAASPGATALAARLAQAISARPEELGELLCDTLADACPALFVAVLARAIGTDDAAARAITLDPDGDRLWLALRTLGLDRAAIARIGLLLAEGDPRRDLDAFADALDSILAIEHSAAHDAIAPMRLHPDFREALRALAATRRR